MSSAAHTHVNLLNLLLTAGVATRFIKVKAHCGEPLNGWITARHCIWIQMLFNFTSETAPVGWGTQVRNHLACLAAGQATAALAVPKMLRDGTVKTPPIATA
jgi:hypothetical protein